jgi:hypothetical protein
MRRKVRRRPVHYLNFAYRDGAVVSSTPIRKPSKRKMKEDGLRVDDDLVCQEYLYGCDQFMDWEMDFRVRVSNLLANRMNMRRTVRELVMPELASIQATLADVVGRLSQIEAALANTQPPQS